MCSSSSQVQKPHTGKPERPTDPQRDSSMPIGIFLPLSEEKKQICSSAASMKVLIGQRLC